MSSGESDAAPERRSEMPSMHSVKADMGLPDFAFSLLRTILPIGVAAICATNG
jgi:hypothetical protein